MLLLGMNILESPVVTILTFFFVCGLAMALMAKSLLSCGLTVPFLTTCPSTHIELILVHTFWLRLSPALLSLKNAHKMIDMLLKS